MLSLSKISGSGNYYLNLAREDYYLNGGEPPGVWLGSATRHLGLFGKADPSDVRSLLAGFSPSGVGLVQNAGAENRQCGWDLTFSAPKSVSLLWALGSEREAREIQAAHFAAVDCAVRYLEAEGCFTRIGRGGTLVESVGVAVCVFEHGTSRMGDPQLHSHALLLNVAHRECGKWGSIDSRPIYDMMMVLGAAYRAEL
ncbi:MAG: MobF family relaxase, partial [Fimbriimonadaceae bacterium]